MTVTPWWFLIARSSSSGRRAVARWRSGELGALSRLGGATGSTAPASARQVRSAKPWQRERRARQLERRLQQPERLARAVPRSARHQLERVRRGRRQPLVRLDRRRLRLEVEQEHAQLDRGEAVDHAVMDLADEPDAAVGQLGRDPELPQRAVAPQRLRQHGVGEVLQPLGGGVVDVLGGIEVLGVDPQRRVQAERVGRDPLAVARRAAEAARDVREQLAEARPGAVLGSRERRGPAHVHVGAGAFDGKERRVERREPLWGHQGGPPRTRLRP